MTAPFFGSKEIRVSEITRVIFLQKGYNVHHKETSIRVYQTVRDTF